MTLEATALSTEPHRCPIQTSFTLQSSQRLSLSLSLSLYLPTYLFIQFFEALHNFVFLLTMSSLITLLHTGVGRGIKDKDVYLFHFF